LYSLKAACFEGPRGDCVGFKKEMELLRMGAGKLKRFGRWRAGGFQSEQVVIGSLLGFEL
jgi:hypothetical protein